MFTSLDGIITAVSSLVQPGSGFLYSSIDLSGLGPVTGPFAIRLIEIGDTQADGSGSTATGGTFRVTDYFDGASFIDTQLTGSTRGVPDGGSTFLLLGLVLLPALRAKAILDSGVGC